MSAQGFLRVYFISHICYLYHSMGLSVVFIHDSLRYSEKMDEQLGETLQFSVQSFCLIIVCFSFLANELANSLQAVFQKQLLRKSPCVISRKS